MTSTDKETTARALVLGAKLRQARLEAGLRCADLSQKLGWSVSKVSRLETGARGTNFKDLISYATLCGIVGTGLDSILALAEQPEGGYWVQNTKNSTKSAKLQALIALEQSAAEIFSFETILIPGLFQTEEYMRTLFREAGSVADSDLDEATAARMKRQGVLRKERPPTIRFFIHESALRIPVGGNGAMVRQMLRLRHLGMRDHIHIRVVPSARGAAGIGSAPFTYFTFTTNSPTAYEEQVGTTIFVDARAEIAKYQRTLRHLAAVSLSEEQSLEIFKNMANWFYQRE